MPKPLLLFLAFAASVVAAIILWPSVPPPPPTHLAAILDWSDSMPSDVDFFVSSVRDGVVKPLRAKSLESRATVDIVVVGSNSATEPFHLDIPALGGSLASDGVAKQALENAEPAITAFVKTALSGHRSSATALLEALPRIPAESGLRLLVVSDGKQASVKTINLEKTKITPGNRESLVRASVAAVGPLTDRFEGAQIQFRLPSLPPDAVDHSVNDAAALESFWRAYFAEAAPRSRLTSFDSRIVAWTDSPEGVKR